MRTTRRTMYFLPFATFGVAACSDLARDPMGPSATPVVSAALAATTPTVPTLRTVLVTADSIVGNLGDTVQLVTERVTWQAPATGTKQFATRSVAARRLERVVTQVPFTGAVRSSDTTVIRPIADGGRFVMAQAGRAGLVVRQARLRDTVGVVVQSLVATIPPDVFRPIAPITPEAVIPAPDASLPPVGNAILPQRTVNTTLFPRTGRTITVPAGDARALQAAFDAAAPGDEIVLPDRAVFSGNFTLPARKAGAGRVVVRSATIPADSSRRVTPAAAASFAKILTPNDIAVLRTAHGAGGWHFVGVEFGMGATSAETFGIVLIGTTFERTLAEMPDDVVFDRVYVHGTPTASTRRCIALNGRSAAVVHSWLSECHHTGFDAQAIVSWAGQGPFLIEDNYLEGSGQDIHFGGGDVSVPGVIPSDITIRRNHLHKPLAWGRKWLVKNSFEMKSAQRVLFEQNFVENSWFHGQAGFAIVSSPAPDSPQAIVQDVTVRDNIFRRTAGGVYILSRWPGVAQPTRRWTLTNNLFQDVGTDPLDPNLKGRHLQIIGDAEDVTITNNTFVGARAANAIMFSGARGARLRVQANVFPESDYDVWGDQGMGGKGMATVNFFYADAVFRDNVIFAGWAAWAGTGNATPSTFEQSIFMNPLAGDFRLPESGSIARSVAQVPGIRSTLASIRSVRSSP